MVEPLQKIITTQEVDLESTIATEDKQELAPVDEEEKSNPATRVQNMVTELDEKINAFKRQFDELNRQFLAKLGQSFNGGFREPEDYKSRPVQKSAAEAAQDLVRCKKITIVTGAGISAASGIPTFRGQEGFWKGKKRYAGEHDPKDICRRTFFDTNPTAVWEWHYDFLKLARGKQVNQGHKAVANFQEFVSQDSGLDSLLLT